MIRENRKTMYVKMGHLEQVREMCRASHFQRMLAGREVTQIQYLSESEFEATKFEKFDWFADISVILPELIGSAVECGDRARLTGMPSPSNQKTSLL